MRWLSFILILSLLGCASMPFEEKLVIGCTLADLGTTAIGVEKGYVETNPFFKDEPVLYGALASLGIHYLLKKLDPPKPAWLAYGSIRCAAAAYNLEKIR